MLGWGVEVGGWVDGGGGGVSVRRGGGGAEDKQRGKGHVAEMLAKIAGST